MCDFGISGHLVDSVAKTMDAGCKPYMAVRGKGEVPGGGGRRLRTSHSSTFQNLDPINKPCATETLKKTLQTI